MSRRTVVSILVGLALATAIHVDWHFARPVVHHLSLGLTWHWLLAVPVFALVALYVARAWPEQIGLASLWIVGGAFLLGGIAEPGWEYYVEDATREWAFGAQRNAILASFVGTGLITYIVTVILARRNTTLVTE